MPRWVKSGPSVFYMRAPQGFDSDVPIKEESFAKDARALISLTDDEIATLAAQIGSDARFVSNSLLKEIVQAAVPRLHEDDAKSVADIVWHLDAAWRRSGRNLDKYVRRTQRTLRAQDTKSPLSTEERERLAVVLERVLIDAPCIARQRKAQAVAQGTGLPLENANLYCDARPVFDDTRTMIEGMVLTTTLKVVATGPDGLPQAIEARLTEDQVTDLAKKAATATTKLRTMAAIFKQKDIPVPAIAADGDE
jgi:hypothetical protein